MALYVPGNSLEVKTVHRAAKRPPIGKLKLSRVTSGYGGLYYLIELGPSELKHIGVWYMYRKKMQNFGQKMGPSSRPEARPAIGSTQKCAYLRPVMILTKKPVLYFWIWYTNISLEYFRPHCVLFKNLFNFNFSTLIFNTDWFWNKVTALRVNP